MFLDKIPGLEEEIDRADKPFEEAVKYSIIGNIIDFNPIHELTYEMIEERFTKLKGETLAINDSEKLVNDIKNANTLMYLGDNCGEICLDKILVKKIKELNPDCRIYFATRGLPVVNDSVEEDAYLIGMDEYATIISNGDYSLGTVLTRTSEEFNRLFEKADVIIAKGQANYECLSTVDKNTYFLLMTKCDVIADDIGCPQMKMILMQESMR